MFILPARISCSSLPIPLQELLLAAKNLCLKMEKGARSWKIERRETLALKREISQTGIESCGGGKPNFLCVQSPWTTQISTIFKNLVQFTKSFFFWISSPKMLFYFFFLINLGASSFPHRGKINAGTDSPYLFVFL